MKTLKHCIKLSCLVKIYVPSTVNVSEDANTEQYVDKTLKFLADQFGGSTASKALGAWISTNNELVKENVTMVFAYAAQIRLEANIEGIYDYCLKLKHDLSQEAIALEVNGEMYLV